MLSKNDLIFLGASIIIGADVNRNGVQYSTDNSSILKAIDTSKQLFNKVFDEKVDNCEMILE